MEIVAFSAAPFGMVAGDQLGALFQIPLAAAAQLALPADAAFAAIATVAN